MSMIKPGKIGVGLAVEKPKIDLKSGQPAVQAREVWDDFAVEKKAKKKKEYERSSGNRMLPKGGAPSKGRNPLSFASDKRDGSADGVQPEEDKPSSRVDYQILEERLGYKFTDHSLLDRALTHRSALGVRERADYERLEFLGDAVLDLSVAHLLSDRHPDAREGELSKMRAALVNTQALAAIAKNLDFGPFIKLGRGEFSSGGSERPSILADVMEAVIGAVYRDSNYDQAMKIIEQIFNTSLEEVTPYDPKTELQEALHAAGSEPPSYLLELVEGPEHAPTFVTVVVVDGEIAGRGRGTTKKAAQQAAAAEALTKMFPSVQPVELAEGQQVLLSPALYVGPAQ
jgi:ribonuclease-3